MKVAGQIVKELVEKGAVTEEDKDIEVKLKPILNEITKK